MSNQTLHATIDILRSLKSTSASRSAQLRGIFRRPPDPGRGTANPARRRRAHGQNHGLAHLRIKITPLIPQPKTPLEFAEAKYDFAMITRMQQWISTQKPRRSTGWFLEQDGCVMGYKNWLWQCRLARGDETLFRSAAP